MHYRIPKAQDETHRVLLTALKKLLDDEEVQALKAKLQERLNQRARAAQACTTC
jgi:hypothetical protein